MRTFVFGAGASSHVKYPLTRDLGSELVKWAAQNPRRRHYRIEADEMYALFPSLEIEEVISELESPTQGSQIDQLPQWKRSSILAGIRETLCEYFDILQLNGAPLYRQFAEQVSSPGDIVISFNYDVSLEAELRKVELWHIGNGYGFPLGDGITPPSEVKILKLHGSTSWIDILFDGARDGDYGVGLDSLGARPVILPQYFEFFGYPPQTVDPRFSGGGSSRLGSMILPARSKVFDVRKLFWDCIWRQASDALRKASEITIIGYSLPPADVRARDLLFREGNKNASISICCGGDNVRIAKELTDAGFASVDLSSTYFNDWLNAL